MPANLKAVQSRIKSAKNTKKITKAMELVSAAKMRKALDAATRTRAYAQHMLDVLHRLAYLDTSLTGLLTIRPVKKVLVITISSNRGLCGSFNANVFKTTRKTLLDTAALKKVINAEGDMVEDTTTQHEDISISIMGIGKKTAWFAKKFQYPLIGVYDELTEQPSFEDVAGIARTVMSGFETGVYDKVLIAYTAFRSSLVQEPMMRQILPVPREILSSFSGKKGYSVSKNETEQYALEPDPAMIVKTVIPKIIESELYHTVLESVASEHSARMLAMKNATDNAGELIDELNLEYNKARQAAITQEIAEIAGGAAALS